MPGGTVTKSNAIVAVVAAAVVFGGLGVLLGNAISSSAQPSAVVTTTTTVPQAIYLGQARDWLAQHGTDLTTISTWAKNLGDAAKSRDDRLVNLAVAEMLLQVGKADGDLPSNAFGDRMHAVFLAYVNALNQIREGLSKDNQALFQQGSDALAAAVAQFGKATAGLR